MIDWVEAVRSQFWWIMAGMAGRLMFHTREAQAGRRRFWGRELPFELIIAVAMGLIGYAVGEYLELSGPVTAGLISALSYLGPRAIDTLFDRALTGVSDVFKGRGK